MIENMAKALWSSLITPLMKGFGTLANCTVWPLLPRTESPKKESGTMAKE